LTHAGGLTSTRAKDTRTDGCDCGIRGAASAASRRGETGRSRTTSRTDLLWQGARTVATGQLEQGPRGLAVPVQVYIPYGLNSTDAPDPDDQIIWSLRAAADIPGVDSCAELTVPVFVTQHSDPGLT
jgi:hypothetical protein